MPRALEALLHPRRRGRLRIDAVDQARDEARARLRVLDAHGARAVERDRRRRRRRAACSGAPVIAATSRAMPASDRQSARLGVILSVISVSSSASASRSGVPGVSDGVEREQAARVVVDAELLGRAQHAARFDAAHRRALDREAAGQRRAFERARAPACRPPRWARRRRSAASRRRRRRRCTRAAGRRSDAARPRRCAPTTTLANGGAAGAASSTSRPDIVSVSHSAAVDSGGLHIVRSQSSENFIAAASCELPAGSAGRSRRTGAGRSTP